MLTDSWGKKPRISRSIETQQVVHNPHIAENITVCKDKSYLITSQYLNNSLTWFITIKNRISKTGDGKRYLRSTDHI